MFDVYFHAPEALKERFPSAASHLVDIGGSIDPPARRPGYLEGRWGRNVHNKSPAYGDTRTADSCRQSTELNPGWEKREDENMLYMFKSEICVYS